MLVIKREFLSRVKKRSFLIATILTPLIFPAIIGGMIYFYMEDMKSADKKNVQVLDESGYFELNDTTKYTYIYLPRTLSLETAKTAFNATEDFALIHIPEFELDNPEGFTMYSKTNPSITELQRFTGQFEHKIRDLKLKRFDIAQSTLDSLNTQISLRSVNIGESGEEKESSAVAAFGIGYAAGFLIYMFIFIYGAQVMQGVIEEKSSKIVEVIVSTLRPMQLMVGKVVGIASVGLTQILIWIALIAVLSLGILAFFNISMPSPEDIELISEGSQAMTANNPLANNPKLMQGMKIAADIPYLYLIVSFIFYFVGGYLMYGALFAAVGSAVDSSQEAQQFMFPITIPLIASIISLNFVLDNPESNFSFWLSVIPFTSPIAMMGRIGFGVPLWELALSMALLVLGFTFTIWVAGRIYRVGILMHGSKVNYKVLAKWFMMRN